MWGVTLYCESCGRGKVVQMPVKDPNQWPECDICGKTAWHTADQPKLPYELNRNDRNFLRSIRVSADE